MKAIGKIDTQTLLIIGGIGIALYMFMNKPATAVSPVYGSILPANQLLANQQAAQGNSTAGIIAGSGSAISSILTAISNF
jgi:hypothetical protein